ncbi:MAG: hypothetical protein H7832_09795 [Magnetococcus sp. DMHC-6]
MKKLHIDLLDNGYGLYDADVDGYLFEGIKDFDLIWDLYEKISDEMADKTVFKAETWMPFCHYLDRPFKQAMRV